MSPQEYFEETKEKKIKSLKRVIKVNELSLEQHRNGLQFINNLSFEDLIINMS